MTSASARPSVISVMLEGARSAEPPMNSGRTGAIALRQSWRKRQRKKRKAFSDRLS